LLEPTVLVGYAGAGSPRLAARFRGTLVAPHATVRLPATPEPHGGAFFAKDIVVADGAVIEHRAFAAEPSTAAPAVVCAACLVEQSAFIRACADRRDRRARQHAGEAAASVARCERNGEPRAAGCKADCDARLTREAAFARAQADGCEEDAHQALTRCEHAAAYRAGVCWQLGFGLAFGHFGYGTVSKN
jgi:hypothetical protein